jgi:hypothetical protein
MRVTDPSVPSEGKFQVYVDGEHHGDEYLGGELAILLVRHLLEDRNDPLVEEVLRSTVVWVTPMLNPDGNARGTRTNYNGIDLNRHYPFAFTPSRSHGDVPATEPEVAANVAFMSSRDLDLYLTLHTGIVVLIHPWGYTEDPCPDDAMFQRLRDVSESHGVPYGQASVELYRTQGSSKDYAYGGLGIPGFTFEVDDEQSRQISRREDIASRLSDELALLMDLIVLSGSMRSRLEVKSHSVSQEAASSGTDVEVVLELQNPTYSPANNTTVTVEVWRAASMVASHRRVADIGPGDGTRVRVRFSIEGEGQYGLRTRVEHPTLLVENATWASLAVDTTSLDVRAGGLAGAGGLGLGLLALLVAVGVAALVYAWRRGWRPGWAVRRLASGLRPSAGDRA